MGPGAPDENGQVHPLDVRPGDRVLFDKWSGTEVKIDSEDVLIMNGERYSRRARKRGRHQEGCVTSEISCHPRGRRADVIGDVVYARLQRSDETIETGYPPNDLDAWAKRVKLWAAGKMPCDLPVIDKDHVPETKPRDVFIYFIHEGKLRAPVAAMGLIERLD